MPSKHTSYFSLNSIRTYTHATKKNATPSFAYGLFNSHSKFWGHLQANALWMKSFTHISCKSIRLLETIFSFSKTMSAYLRYGKELFASWSCHTSLTGASGLDPYPIGHPWDILGRWVHGPIPSQLPHFLNLSTSWLIPQGGGGTTPGFF